MGGTVSSRLRAPLQALVNLLFPAACAACGAAGPALCDRCAQQVEPFPGPLCARCGSLQPRAVAVCAACAARPAPSIALMRAVTVHGPPMRALIHALKYEGRRELGAPLARYLAAGFAAPEWQAVARGVDAVVPVPIHAERLRERGYNQSELIARPFAAVVGLAVEAEWLTRTRHTRQQVGLNAVERQVNVRDAFAAAPAVRGAALLLVDDVCTTGATMHACAAAAFAAGARAVYALALARPAFLPAGHEPIP